MASRIVERKRERGGGGRGREGKKEVHDKGVEKERENDHTQSRC